MAVLSRVQRNELFELIQSNGLAPSTFEFIVEPGARGEFDVLRHAPTGSYMKFSFGTARDYRLDWWPAIGSGPASRNSFPDAWADYRDSHGVIRPGAKRLAANWIAEVKANNDAPDLWGEIAKERAMIEATRPDGTVFTQDDVTQLRAGLGDLQKYMHSLVTDAAHRRLVDARILYLAEAAEVGSRKDFWMGIFVAQIVSMVIDGILSTQQYGDVMRHAKSVIGAIFQAGMKLLGS